MKHYTYKEKYEIVKRGLSRYKKACCNCDGYERVCGFGPKMSYSVRYVNRDNKKKIVFSIVAEKSSVGYGIESIKNIFWKDQEHFLVFHDLCACFGLSPFRMDWNISVRGNKVVFTTNIKPFED